MIPEDEDSAICGDDYEPYEIETQINEEQRTTNFNFKFYFVILIYFMNLMKFIFIIYHYLSLF